MSVKIQAIPISKDAALNFMKTNGFISKEEEEKSTKKAGRPIKIQKCKCGESNPLNFLPNYKGLCKKCKSKKTLEKYYASKNKDKCKNFDFKEEKNVSSEEEKNVSSEEEINEDESSDSSDYKNTKLNDFVNGFFNEYETRIHSKIYELLRFAPHTVIENILTEINEEIESSLILTYKIQLF